MGDRILVIDDDPTFNAVLTRALARRGFEVLGCQAADLVLETARRFAPDKIILDLNLEGRSGLALIRPLLQEHDACRIVVLTGYASVTTAVDAIKLGAVQYLAKPADVTAILNAFDSSSSEADNPAPLPQGPMSVGRLEWEHIQRVLKDCHGNVSQAARLLGLHRRSLQRKLSKYPSAR